MFIGFLKGSQFSPLKSRARRGCPVSSLLFNPALEVLATAVRQERKLAGLQIGEEDIKVFLLTDDLIVYVQIPRTNK